MLGPAVWATLHLLVGHGLICNEACVSSLQLAMTWLDNSSPRIVFHFCLSLVSWTRLDSPCLIDAGRAASLEETGVREFGIAFLALLCLLGQVHGCGGLWVMEELCW